MEYDVVVLGAGGAGLSAAATAAESGRSVLLLESESEVGGSTILSAGMFTAGGTSVQETLGVMDTPELMFQHYQDLNQWRLQPGLVRAFCNEAAPTFEWLLGLGLEVPARFSHNAHQPGLAQGGVGDVWRSHVPKDEGYGLVQVLQRATKASGVETVLNTRVEQLLTAAGTVTGVIADGVPIRCSSVVIGTGGFAHDEKLLAAHYPRALEVGDPLFVVAAPAHRGDHFRLGEQVGAAVAGSGWGLLLLTAYFVRHHHWRAGFPPKSRVYVDGSGRRFVDEDVSYAVSTGILDDHGGWCWAVFDETARLSLPPGYADWTPDRVAQEADAGRTYRADSIENLATVIGVPADALRATVADWNEMLPAGKEDTAFLRHRTLAAKGVDGALDPIEEGPYYAVRMQPAELVCTHAGLEIDAAARVRDATGRVIDGLFAAGEAGGGVLGQAYVGGGNSVANAITMGRIAGRGAAA
jgi:fumarate reductase flavoprotein subunit